MDKSHTQEEIIRIPFSEENFQKGFRMMDTTKDGKVDIQDIRMITLNKVKRENLYTGKD